MDLNNIPSAKGDHYWALQIDPNASQQIIEDKYQRLHGKYQGLVALGQTDYAELLQLTEEAYAVLSDPKKRKAYDDSLKPPPKEQTKLFVTWQILLLVGLNLFVFWWNYNADPPGIALGAAPLMLIVFIIYLSIAIKGKQKNEIVKALVLGISLMTVNVLTYLNFQNQELYVDNQNPYEIYVNVDGEFNSEIKSYKYEITALKVGTHEIKTFKKQGDSLIEKFEVEVSHRETNMYNVLSKGEYISGKKKYSENATLKWIRGDVSEPYPEYEIKERWFKLSQTYIFEKPPSTITIKKKITDFGDAEEVRSYLIRKNARYY